MGGLSLAARELGMRIAVGADINTQAGRTFSKNFPEAEFIEGSIRSPKVLQRCFELLKPQIEAPPPSIILSGPPCQGFSLAGSRNPADPRNRILAAVARAIARLNPHCALIENVSMVLAKTHANRLDGFREILAATGYFMESIVVDARDFGVAQRRKRAFLLVTNRKLDTEHLQDRLNQLQQPELTVKEALVGLPSPPIRPDDYSDEETYGDFPNHLAMRHSEAVMKKIAGLEPGMGPMSYRKLHAAQPAKTLFSGHRAPPAHFHEPRSITVREAARLQGFPDCFRIYGSFAEQMQQVTNAVPPPLTIAVLTVLLELAGIPAPMYA